MIGPAFEFGDTSCAYCGADGIGAYVEPERIPGSVEPPVGVFTTKVDLPTRADVLDRDAVNRKVARSLIVNSARRTDGSNFVSYHRRGRWLVLAGREDGEYFVACVHPRDGFAEFWVPVVDAAAVVVEASRIQQETGVIAAARAAGTGIHVFSADEGGSHRRLEGSERARAIRRASEDIWPSGGFWGVVLPLWLRRWEGKPWPLRRPRPGLSRRFPWLLVPTDPPLGEGCSGGCGCLVRPKAILRAIAGSGRLLWRALRA